MYNPELIKQSNDLLAIAEMAGARFKRVNGEYRSHCPIHNGDNSSAFAVYEQNGEQRWCCFTKDCGTGDVISFVQKWKGYDFNQACEFLGGEKKSDPLEIARLAEERTKRQIEALKIEHAKTEKLIAELQQTAKWLEYNRIREEDKSLQMIWNKEGIPQEWQDYWQLGYCRSFRTMTEGGLWQTPSLTIPVFQDGWENVRDIRHRLINPFKPNDKYRPERPGVGSQLYFTDPVKMYDASRILIVEGEKKAMVTYLTVNEPDLQVIGLPGKKSIRMLFDKFSGQDIYVWLDPDADDQAVELAKNIKARVVYSTIKIDDAIMQRYINKADIYHMLLGARRFN